MHMWITLFSGVKFRGDLDDLRAIHLWKTGVSLLASWRNLSRASHTAQDVLEGWSLCRPDS